MKPHLWIDKITFKNDYNLNLKKNSINVFVGPNNTGKSAILKDIDSLLSNVSSSKILVKTLSINVPFDENTFLGYLEQFPIHESAFFTTIGGRLHKANTNYAFGHLTSRLGDAKPFFAQQLFTSQRLDGISPPQNINRLTAPPQHAIHIIQRRDSMEFKFNSYFKNAFGKDIIVNRGAGSLVPLHVGKAPEYDAINDRVSEKYLDELSKLPLLHEQGDGMKSFTNVFLNLYARDMSINIVDEPEAFLHPPQAKLLGQMISKELDLDKQFFIATHSEHFLKGLLDYAGERLNIIRIQRENDINTYSLLQNDEIKNIWSDSLLRHSNILDGLFHSEVVVCESDSDCRFFSAILTSISEAKGDTAPDILFVQCGGKHRFPIVINALQKINVPLKVICDFDLFNNENPIRYMFEGFGGNWLDIEKNFRIVKNAIDKKKPELDRSDLKEAIESIFTEITEKTVSDNDISRIKDKLKKASPWSEAKLNGKSFIPSGEATRAYNELNTALEAKGIFVLDIGEIEAFDKSFALHGPKWVNKVLEKDILNNPDLQLARDFVKNKIMTSIA
ncbi:MAG: AAA family ATPase [Mucilaginibacter sp.]|uniref:ATP-dependent nuclease n=1 Tax=Mucilaginibacter sp. TaxID=1882438 RepID=UPI0031A2B52D